VHSCVAVLSFRRPVIDCGLFRRQRRNAGGVSYSRRRRGGTHIVTNLDRGGGDLCAEIYNGDERHRGESDASVKWR